MDQFCRACVCLLFLSVLCGNASVSGAQLNFRVQENLPVGSIVGQVTAQDSTPGVPVSFEIDGASPASRAFIISPEGLLLTALPLDRESLPVYNFNVIARNGGRPDSSSRIPVQVKVVDVNDNAPMFVWPPEWPISEVSVSRQNVRPGQILLVAQATDADAGDFGRVRYSISMGNRGGPFYIDRDSGSVLVVKPLPLGVDRYELTLTARDCSGCDGDTNSLSTMTSVIVNVLP